MRLISSLIPSKRASCTSQNYNECKKSPACSLQQHCRRDHWLCAILKSYTTPTLRVAIRQPHHVWRECDTAQKHNFRMHATSVGRASNSDDASKIESETSNHSFGALPTNCHDPYQGASSISDTSEGGMDNAASRATPRPWRASQALLW